MSKEAQKMSKMDEKRIQMHRERRQRLINRGVSPDKVEEYVAREDYERLPLDKKVVRLESFLASAQEGFAQDVQALQYNQQVLAEAMDTNFTAFEMMVTDLGVGAEKQKEYIDKAKIAVAARKKAVQEARAKAAEEAQKKQISDEVSQQGVPPPPPEEATVFGE